MARKIGLILILVVLAGMIFGSCATYSTRSGVKTPHGAFTSAGVNGSREGDVIASYNVILGLVTTGYDEFLEKTKGHTDLDMINTDYFGWFTIYKAVKR